MVEIPKRGGWGGSAIWEKVPNNPVFFSDAFPKTEDVKVHLGIQLRHILQPLLNFQDIVERLQRLVHCSHGP